MTTRRSKAFRANQTSSLAQSKAQFKTVYNTRIPPPTPPSAPSNPPTGLIQILWPPLASLFDPPPFSHTVSLSYSQSVKSDGRRKHRAPLRATCPETSIPRILPLLSPRNKKRIPQVAREMGCPSAGDVCPLSWTQWSWTPGVDWLGERSRASQDRGVKVHPQHPYSRVRRANNLPLPPPHPLCMHA